MIYGAIDTSENQSEPYSGQAAVAAGVNIWWARNTIGWARQDPKYFVAKWEAEDNGLRFGGYSLNWPANRNGRREGQYALDHMTSAASPKAPAFLVEDAELGTNPTDAANYAVPADVIVVNILYHLEELAKSGLPTFHYTGGWLLKHPKMAAAYRRYAEDLRKYPLILAEYPFQGKWYELLHGGPVRPAQFDPWLIKPTLPSRPSFPEPWTDNDILGWQWSSYGKQQSIVSNRAPYDRLDYSCFFWMPGGPPAPTLEERVAALEQKSHTH